MADTLTANLFPATARASVSLSWTSAPVPATALVERVNPDGSVVPVRAADPATLVAGAWVGDDYEVPLDAPFYYQATSTTRPGVVLTSPLYTLVGGGATWLKHPGRPALNMKIDVARAPDWTRPVTAGVFAVLGRSRPVAVSATRGSERGDLTVNTYDEAERLSLLGLLADGGVLYLSTPDDYGLGNVYVSVGDVGERRYTHVANKQEREWTLPLTVVDRPIGTALAAGNTWGDVLTEYASWSQLLASEGTWAGALEGIGD